MAGQDPPGAGYPPGAPPSPEPAWGEDPDRFAVPTRLAPVSPVLDVVVASQQVIVPLAFIVIALPSAYLSIGALITVIGVVFAFQFLRWQRFSYRIDGETLRIEEGVLARKRREVPLRRIQQVDIQRKLRHRAFGVCIVSIDTAGGGSGAEVVLDAITDADALTLRRALLAGSGRAAVATPGSPASSGGAEPAAVPWPAATATGGAVPAPPEQQLVARLTTWDLVKAGITGSRLAAALPIAGIGFGFFAELPATISDEVADSAGDLLTVGIVIPLLLLMAVPFVLIAAAGVSVFSDHDFTLVRVGDDLHLSRGLLDQREATLSLHRIQVVRIQDNPLRRWLGVCSVQLQSAGSASEAQGSVSRITIPIVPNEALAGVLHQTVTGAAPLPPLVPAPTAARRRAWFRRMVPASLVVALLVVITANPWALLAAVILIPTAIGAEMAYRGLGHSVLASYVVARRGGFMRETVVIPIAKTQSTRLTTSLLQHRLGLATLLVDVAGQGRTPAVVDGAADRLIELRRGALGATAARADESEVRRRNRGEVAEQLPFAP